MEQPPEITGKDADTAAALREQVERLVVENQGWAESIARSVARSWNMDWRLDGLDGAAMEALVFCARRFQADRGVPFRGYARRRIHEASTEQARRSRGWKTGFGGHSADQKARELSAQLLNVFPELRSGEIPFMEEGEGDTRSAVRQLIVGASLLASKEPASDAAAPDELVD